MNALVIGKSHPTRVRGLKAELDESYLPVANFYCGNGKSISGSALQNLAEYLGDYRCMPYVRKAFAEVLDSLDMSIDDRAYYKSLAGLEK